MSWSNATNSEPLDGPEASHQKNWDRVGITMVKAKLISDCQSEREKASILASQAPHSGDWLHALPITSCGLRMDFNTVRAAVGFRLGTRMCLPHTCSCGKEIDAYGIHCLACKRSAGRHMRHNIIDDIIFRSFAKAGISAVREPMGLDRTDKKRPDGVTLMVWQQGKCLLWDATVPDTLCETYRKKSAQEAGSAAELAATNKKTKYNNLMDKYIFVPVAIETLGPINMEGMEFLKMLGQKISEKTNDKRETSFLFQRISVAIQCGNASSFLGSFGDIAGIDCLD